MGIEIKKNRDDTYSVFINGTGLGPGWYPGRFIVPKALLKGVKLQETPNDILFEICDKIEENNHHRFRNTIRFIIYKIDNNKARVNFEEWANKDVWPGDDIEFYKYMQTEIDLIKERQKEVNDIEEFDSDINGNPITLSFSTVIEGETFDSIIDSAEQIIDEIEGAVEIKLTSSFENIDQMKDEKEFTKRILILLIRKLGFSNVKYNHGIREYGKDITFSRNTEFDEYEFYGAQVKLGDISGGAGSEIDKIFHQIEDAFEMPFNNVYTKRKESISKMLIVISGKFTDNAIEKICEKIQSHAIRNNIIFIDREKIETLIEKFYKNN